MILHAIIVEILSILDFSGGHLGKWPKQVVSPSFFSGNIAILTLIGPLKKMIPPMKDHGGDAR